MSIFKVGDELVLSREGIEAGLIPKDCLHEVFVVLGVDKGRTLPIAICSKDIRSKVYGLPYRMCKSELCSIDVNIFNGEHDGVC